MRPLRTTRIAVAAGIAALAIGSAFVTAATGSAAQPAAQYQVLPNIGAGIAAALPNPAASPAGVNVSGCRPSSAHPYPVVLVDGTFANMIDDWSGLGPTLANEGYCVYSAAIGAPPSSFIQTYGAVADSAKQVAALVDSALAQTGASQVDLVGHSQGGMLAEYYAKVLGGAPKVHDLVGLSPTTHGTTLDGLAVLASAFPGGTAIVNSVCPACADQITGSPVIRTLDNGPIAQSGVSYTIIETRNETVVTPAGSAFIQESGVQNEWVQDHCPFDPVDHVDLTYDHTVYGLVNNALDPANAKPVGC